MEHFLLQRNVNLLVSIAGAFPPIVEWPHERIRKEDPDKSFRIKIVGHHGAVRDPLLDVQFVENVRKISLPTLLLQLCFLLHQPFGVFGRKIIVRVAEERFGGRDEFGIRVA